MKTKIDKILSVFFSFTSFLISIILLCFLAFRISGVDMGYILITTHFNKNDTEYKEFLSNETKNINNCITDKCKVDSIKEWIYWNWSRMKDMDDDGKVNCKDASYTYMLLSKIHGIPSWYCQTKHHVLLLSKIDGEFIMVDPSNMNMTEGYDTGTPFLDEYMVCDLNGI